eukprot:3934262-Rhodomonas_salina.1
MARTPRIPLAMGNPSRGACGGSLLPPSARAPSERCAVGFARPFPCGLGSGSDEPGSAEGLGGLRRRRVQGEAAGLGPVRPRGTPPAGVAGRILVRGGTASVLQRQPSLPPLEVTLPPLGIGVLLERLRRAGAW